MTFTLSPELLIALALNLLTAGALWGNFASRITTAEREIKELKGEARDHNDMRSLVAKLEAELAGVRKDLDRLLELFNRGLARAATR